MECEGCDAHAHRQCVPTIWADDDFQKASGGAGGAGLSQQPFKFACPTCEAREPVVSYSEACTMQTSGQNGHHASRCACIQGVSGLREGVSTGVRQGRFLQSIGRQFGNHAKADTHTPTGFNGAMFSRTCRYLLKLSSFDLWPSSLMHCLPLPMRAAYVPASTP